LFFFCLGEHNGEPIQSTSLRFLWPHPKLSNRTRLPKPIVLGELAAPRNTVPLASVQVLGDGLTVRYRSMSSRNSQKLVGSAQADQPVPRRRSVYYYEVTVKDRGDEGRIRVGFADASNEHGRQPG
jgi:hypothetical protein